MKETTIRIESWGQKKSFTGLASWAEEEEEEEEDYIQTDTVNSYYVQ